MNENIKFVKLLVIKKNYFQNNVLFHCVTLLGIIFDNNIQNLKLA